MLQKRYVSDRTYRGRKERDFGKDQKTQDLEDAGYFHRLHITKHIRHASFS
jgi:hypothetical protein